MALESIASGSLSLRDDAHIKWAFPGDLDNTSLSQLATWAKGPDPWTNAEKDEGVVPENDYLKKLMLEQYTEMRDHSPAQTLHLAAELIIETRRYLEHTYLNMDGQYTYQEGNYHNWAAEALKMWAGPIECGLSMAESHNERLARKEGERPGNVPWYKPASPLGPPPKHSETLRSLSNTLIKLSTDLATTEEVLLPQFSEIEQMVCTGHMWAPKMVDVFSSIESRSPNSFIKICDERGYAADLFVRANADFHSDIGLRNRIASLKQILWLPHPHCLPDGCYSIAPEIHLVRMPKAAWHTVARVAAMLRPHSGRQANLESILEHRWGSNGHWLEKEMEEFFQRTPDTDPTRLLLDDTCPTSTTSLPPFHSESISVEEKTEEEERPSAQIWEWQKTLTCTTSL